MPAEASPAFTGAMGWAKFAFANPPQNYNPNFWYEVTKTDDYLPGQYDPGLHQNTLRWAVEHLTGPRNIKVLVNGKIRLKAQIRLEDETYVKISGEYATGIGPTVTGDEFLIEDCNNIVLRYMRFRSGIVDLENPRYHCGRSLSIHGSPTGGCNDIIVDHCSIGASRDDNFSAYGKLCRITVQNCIIGGGAVGVSKAGIGSGGSYGPGSSPSHEYETLTYCRNFITNTRERQLIFSGLGRADFFNNLVSINRHALQLFSSDGTHNPQINIIANHFHTANMHQLRGYFEDPIRAIVTTNPYTPNSQSPLLVTSGNDDTIHISGNLYMRFDIKDDVYVPVVSPTTDPQWQLTYAYTTQHNPPGEEPDFPSSLARDTPFDMPSGDTILDADDVETHVLANAGCRLPTSQPALDEYDLDLVVAHGITGPTPSNAIFPEPDATNDGNPGIPVLVAPAHNATGVSTSTTLEWQASDETDHYEVFLDTSISPTTSIGVTSNTQIQASNLQGSTLYRWRVEGRNVCGSNIALSPIRAFTTE